MIQICLMHSTTEPTGNIAGWIVRLIDSASDDNRTQWQRQPCNHHGRNNSTRTTATPHYMTRWQIYPDMMSQLCRRRCRHAPLAVKKQRCLPFRVVWSREPYPPLAHLPRQDRKSVV